MPEFLLYCQADGQCILKQKGVAGAREFGDILEVVTFISYLEVDRRATLTVYDAVGRVMFKDLLSARKEG